MALLILGELERYLHRMSAETDILPGMVQMNQTCITLRDKEGHAREFSGPPNGDPDFGDWFDEYVLTIKALLIGGDIFHPAPEDPKGRYRLTNADGDELDLRLDEGFIRRARTRGPKPEEAFAVARDALSYVNAASNFALRGFDMLGGGKWYPTFALLALAKIRAEFEDTDPIIRMDPRELADRLATLGRLRGTLDETDGVSAATFRTPEGISVASWFTRPGRGAVVLYDPESPLLTTTRTANAALFTGVPKDLADLARHAPATSVLVWAAPGGLSNGTLAALHRHELPLSSAATGALWGALNTVEEANQQRSAKDAAAPTEAEQIALDNFLDLWEEEGYDSRWSLHHVITPRTGTQRGRATAAIDALGLHVVDTPKDSDEQEVWVLSDPRIADALEERS